MDLFNCNKKKHEPTNEVSGVKICKEKTFFRTQFDIKKKKQNSDVDFQGYERT